MQEIAELSASTSKMLSSHGRSECRLYERWAMASAKLGAAWQVARVLFCIELNCMVLLHGFIKKTQKTLQKEIDLAVKRMKGERA
jgi:hypothetical protein